MSLEVAEVNSTWDYRKSRKLYNFICNEGDVEGIVREMRKNEYWIKDSSFDSQLKAILAPQGTRNSSNYFFGDDVAVEEIKLQTPPKPSMKYFYKIHDYSNEKLSYEYGTPKDIIAYISKKVKTKYAEVSYNGKTEKIENTSANIAEILDELEITTSQFYIEPVGRSEMNNVMILVSIFNNYVK